MVRGGQAGRLADGTVDVCDHPAGPADKVVVIVADPRLIASDGTRRLDPPHQTHVGQSMQHVVHGLPGDFGQAGTHDAEDRFGVGVRIRVHRLEHGDPWAGHAQVSRA